MEETLLLHCDKCVAGCKPPTFEQIAEWERENGARFSEDVPLYCTPCMQAWAARETC
jgi:hypothetical protein